MAAKAFDLDVDVSGFEGILERLIQLKDLTQKKGVRAAVRKAMVPVRERARAKAQTIDDLNTPKSQIWRNIVINESARGGKRVGGIVMRVGVRGGALSRVDRTAAKGGAGFRYDPDKKKYVRVKTFRPTKKEVTHPGGDTVHWRFVELGYTPKGGSAVPARPFISTAMKGHEQEITNDLAEQLKLQLAKLGAPLS